MRDTQLVVVMRLLQKRQITHEPILALPPLDLLFHHSHVRGHLELLAIAEPDVVVGVAFDEMHALGFERGAEIGKGLAEEAGEEQERGPLIEALRSCRSVMRPRRESVCVV